ncbi:MAG: cation transporter [Candidatus Peribacteria bacterium]|jgi:cation transport ATPase|nr:cation transporter [Candidatus Peribacteria bacterium]
MQKTYHIDGMHCASCATLIQGEMKDISQITSCDINLINHTATLDFADDELPIDQLNKRIQPFGYTFEVPTSPSSEQTLTKANSTENPLHEKELSKTKREMRIAIPFIVLSLFLMSRMLGAEYGVLGIQAMPEGVHYFATRRLLPLAATFIICTIGRKYLKAVRTYIRYGKATMDTLVGIGTGFAYLYSLFITLFVTGLLFDLIHSAGLERFSQYLSQYLDPNRVFYEAVIIVIGFISIGKYMEQRTMSKT